MVISQPHLEILGLQQRHLWPAFRGIDRLVLALYGGIAIAMRLAHRTSVDFDFFCHGPLQRDALRQTLPWIAQASVLQDQPDTHTLLTRPGGVKVSFFGGVHIGCITLPEKTNDEVMSVASLLDLLGTKLKVILKRAEAKDDQDVVALLTSGLKLSTGIAAARALYGVTVHGGANH